MSFSLELPPVPDCSNPAAVRNFLFQQRELLIRFIGHLNDVGCGLKFDSDNRLAVRLNGSTIACDTTLGLSVTASAIDHGALGGLTDDDHTQYLKEKASGGLASEVPTHSHQSAAEAGTLDHGLALTGLTDDDHTQYVKKSLFTQKGDILVGRGASDPAAQAVGANGTVLTADSTKATGVDWV